MTRRKGISASNDEGMLALLRSEAEVCTIVGKTWDFHVLFFYSASASRGVNGVSSQLRL